MLQLTNALSQAYFLFDALPKGEDHMTCNRVLGKAKTLLAEAEFYVDNNIPHENLLEKLKSAEDLFALRGSFNYQALAICLQSELLIKTDLMRARQIVDQALQY